MIINVVLRPRSKTAWGISREWLKKKHWIPKISSCMWYFTSSHRCRDSRKPSPVTVLAPSLSLFFFYKRLFFFLFYLKKIPRLRLLRDIHLLHLRQARTAILPGLREATEAGLVRTKKDNSHSLWASVFSVSALCSQSFWDGMAAGCVVKMKTVRLLSFLLLIFCFMEVRASGMCDTFMV